MDDAMIISCGHSVGNAGRKQVMETVSSNLSLLNIRKGRSIFFCEETRLVYIVLLLIRSTASFCCIFPA